MGGGTWSGGGCDSGVAQDHRAVDRLLTTSALQRFLTYFQLSCLSRLFPRSLSSFFYDVMI